MKTFRLFLLIILVPFAPRIGKYAAWGCSLVDGLYASYVLPQTEQELRQETERISHLHELVGKPRPGDWRATTIQANQNFAQYALSDPVRPTSDRDTIYVLPLGEFSEKQKEIVDLSAEFLGLYFGCPVQLMPNADSSQVSDAACRIHPRLGHEQFLSTWIQIELLKPQLPTDAVALIALTATDLWPGQNWNFVFGQASLKDRVGVWSMVRYGDPDAGPAEFRECLRRTLKTATHETGHMFSMRHCVLYRCNMAGSGSLEESDRGTLRLCPECLAKLHFAVRPEPAERFHALERFCADHELAREQLYFKEAGRLIVDDQRD